MPIPAAPLMCLVPPTGQQPTSTAADMEAGLYGESTETSIQAGVWQGYLSECGGMIRKYRAKYEHLKVIITGGDAAAVKDKLKMTIFAFPDLVLYGLMQMLKYDIEKQ